MPTDKLIINLTELAMYLDTIMTVDGLIKCYYYKTTKPRIL